MEKMKLQHLYLKGMTLVCGMALANMLTGCGVSKPETYVVESNQESVDANQESNNVDDSTDSSETDSSRLEDSLNIILDEGSKLKEQSEEAANNEEVREEFERCLKNFIFLKDFVMGETDINGVYYNDLTDSAKEKVNSALNKLDDTLESVHPNYKEDFKEWFTDKAASLLDKFSDLKDDGAMLWDEIQSKRKTK
ncbi:MAG: hypothetical protein PUA73_04560 [Bacilli bacterium]|nr:hypothetical protein [Bacilli bacterium]